MLANLFSLLDLLGSGFSDQFTAGPTFNHKEPSIFTRKLSENPSSSSLSQKPIIIIT
jgi:hypothetical protein